MSILYCSESGQESSSQFKKFSLLSSVFVLMKSTLQIVHVSQIGDSNTSEPAVVALSGNRILRELSEVTDIDLIFILILQLGVNQNIQLSLKL